jgi:hypothetical protein
MKNAVSLTLNEAGYVAGQSRATINRAVDQGVIKASSFGEARRAFEAMAGVWDLETDSAPVEPQPIP